MVSPINHTFGVLAGFNKHKIEPEPIKPTIGAEFNAVETAVAVEAASKLPHNYKGYVEALDLKCWMSNSKGSGSRVTHITKMDSSYIVNAMRVIKDNRHPVVNDRNKALMMDWIDLFNAELQRRGEKAE